MVFFFSPGKIFNFYEDRLTFFLYYSIFLYYKDYLSSQNKNFPMFNPSDFIIHLCCIQIFDPEVTYSNIGSISLTFSS